MLRVTDKHQNSKDADGAACFKRRRVLMEKHASRSENEPLPKQCHNNAMNRHQSSKEDAADAHRLRRMVMMQNCAYSIRCKSENQHAAMQLYNGLIRPMTLF